MLRDGYRYKDPTAAQTWSVIGGEAMCHKTPRAPAMAAVIVGHSGTGKTQAILRALDLGPSQVSRALHEHAQAQKAPAETPALVSRKPAAAASRATRAASSLVRAGPVGGSGGPRRPSSRFGR